MSDSKSGLKTKYLQPNKIAKLIGVLIVFHVVLSITFIFFPHFLKSSTIATIYKGYFTPGPFFSEDRIIKTNYLFVEWKDENGWSTSINPALVNYNRGLSKANPMLLYRSRLDRAVFQKWMTSALSGMDSSLARKSFQREVLPYYKNRYVPVQKKSVRLIIIQQQAIDFKVKLDTLYTFQF